jgi:hypothetical protein
MNSSNMNFRKSFQNVGENDTKLKKEVIRRAVSCFFATFELRKDRSNSGV